MVWIGVIIVITVITVCEIALFFARRSPLVARLYGLGYLVKSDGETRITDGAPDRPTPRDRTNASRLSGAGYATRDGRCSFPATPVTTGRRTLQLSGNARCFRLW